MNERLFFINFAKVEIAEDSKTIKWQFDSYLNYFSRFFIDHM